MANEKLTEEQLKDLSSRVNSLFSSLNTDDITSESSGFSEVPEGYFLCEVVKDELTLSKSSGNPQVAFRFKIVEDGRTIEDTAVTIKNSKSGSLFKYYRLVDDKDARKFVSDMLKFEVDENHTSLPKEAFTDDSTIYQALEVIKGLRIYVQNTVDLNDDGTKSTWVNLISWKRAAELGLPC